MNCLDIEPGGWTHGTRCLILRRGASSLEKAPMPEQWRTASMVLVSSCIYHVLEVWCTCMLNFPTCPLIFSRDKQEGASPLHTPRCNGWHVDSCTRKLRVSATDEHPPCDTKMKIKLMDFSMILSCSMLSGLHCEILWICWCDCTQHLTSDLKDPWQRTGGFPAVRMPSRCNFAPSQMIGVHIICMWCWIGIIVCILYSYGLVCIDNY